MRAAGAEAARRVVVDAFPESLSRYGDGWAVVAVDILRATTTAVTALAAGRRCFPVATLSEAHAVAATLCDPLLAGECAGEQPAGFHEQNSPAALAGRTDVQRPVVLLSTSGTRLLQEQTPGRATYAACLRNASATVEHLLQHHDRIAVIGAGTRGELRVEDVLGCAWVAAGLLEAGFTADPRSRRIAARWRHQPLDVIGESKSADYLRRTGQLADLEFVLSHIDDLDHAYVMRAGELVSTGCEVTAVPRGAA